MNRTLYKNALKNISVSDKTIDELIIKAGKYTAQPVKRGLLRRASIPVAALLAASLITVSAASGLGVGDTFKDFFNQFFGTRITDKQIDIIEKYGSVPNKAFSKDGVNLSIDGVIADSSVIYLKYSINLDKGFDPVTHSMVSSGKLYMGDSETGIKPLSVVSVSKNFIQDKNNPYKFNYSSMFTLDDNSPAYKNATFVMKSQERYHSTGVDLKEAFEQFNSEKKLSIQLDSQYEKIFLKSLIWKDGKFKIGVDYTKHFELPEFYLRDKTTGRIFCPYNDYEELDNILFRTFEVIDAKELDRLELVMPEEYHFSFPVSYVKNTKTIDLSNKEHARYINTKINKIRISPLSLNIYGTTPKEYTSGGSKDFTDRDCSLRLKDKTILSSFKFSKEAFDESKQSFSTDIYFEAPLDIDSLEALIIKKIYDSEQLEIPLN